MAGGPRLTLLQENRSGQSCGVSKRKCGITAKFKMLREVILSNKVKFIVFGLILLFASVKCSSLLFSDELIRYSLLDLKKTGQWQEGDQTPRFLTLNPTRYKHENGVIYSETNGFVHEFRAPNCRVFDIKNWQCDETSQTGRTYSHGYRNGEPFEYSSTPLNALKGYVDVPFFRYWMTNCQWLLEDNIASGIAICAISLFSLG